MKRRISLYVDGFNLFYGLKTLPFKYYRWLNLEALAQQLINPVHEEIVAIHYFTTRVINNARKQSNQEKYLAALKTCPKVQVHFGEFKEKEFQCPNCSRPFRQPIEKITDVNISVQALLGAHRDEYDVAYILTGDTDLITLMDALATGFGKDFKIVFPPGRHNDKLKNKFPQKYRQLKSKMLQQCLFKREIMVGSYKITCPLEWQVSDSNR